jgi:hypothetical protein
VFQNDIVWTRSAQGVYLATLTGAFTLNKTVVYPLTEPILAYYALGGHPYVYGVVISGIIGTDSIQITTQGYTNTNEDELLNTRIEICVYP